MTINIEYIKGKSILESNCRVLINPVNCVGVMGAGLALQFKNKFPIMFEKYKEKCETGKFVYGGLPYCVEDSDKIIILFQTKNHWKEKSNIDKIERSLFLMMQSANKWKLFEHDRIACPKLGCGYGGLNWVDVRPKVEYYLSKINCEGIELYE